MLSPLQLWRTRKLTLFGRSLVLFVGEVLANLLLWCTAVALLAPIPERRSVLSLALIAWTLGLRHGLDMDHIVAIDNVTRNLVSMGQLPVTCGLFFSLGHSTIVLAVTIAIIISVASINNMDGVASVGGVIGVSVSASFLLILAIINSFVLHFALKKRRQLRAESLLPCPPPSTQLDLPTEKDVDLKREPEENPEKLSSKPPHLPALSCIARAAKPLFKLLDRPWKMYPIGVVFGFGFDTSSSIALLGVSAIASTGTAALPPSQIIILPLLFTAGMSFVDSCDSIFMLHAYVVPSRVDDGVEGEKRRWWKGLNMLESTEKKVDEEEEGVEPAMPDVDKLVTVQIVLTVISIVIALMISIVEFMGLAAEKCGSCAEAAENDPGLSGRWWRFWIGVNDSSGYLGAAVVGIFVLVFGGWGVQRWIGKRNAVKARASVELPVQE